MEQVAQAAERVRDEGRVQAAAQLPEHVGAAPSNASSQARAADRARGECQPDSPDRDAGRMHLEQPGQLERRPHALPRQRNRQVGHVAGQLLIGALAVKRNLDGLRVD